MRQTAKSKKIFFGLAFIALLGTVTNYAYFSPLLTLLLPLGLFVFTEERLRRPIAWLYVFGLMFITSAVIYDPTCLFTFGFYRRDGNFIIAYAPLMVLPLFTFDIDLKKYIRYFFIFAVTLYALLFLRYLIGFNETADITHSTFHGLFHAPNAIGGFLSVLGGLAFAYAIHRNTKKEWLFFMLVFVILVTTYSRGSILGLILGIGAWWLATRGYFKTLIIYLMVPVLLTIGALMIGYPYYKHKIGRSTFAREKVSNGNGVGIKKANILIRILYTFPRAYYSFKQSPIVGTGVGSFDDRPYQFQQIIPYVTYNAQPKKLHTDSTAHHSYLMFLAEQGILGLGIFLVFWLSLFWYLMRLKDRPILKDFLLISFFNITIAAFTGHRLTTPSIMLPFTIPLGLLMAEKKIIPTYIIRRVKNETVNY